VKNNIVIFLALAIFFVPAVSRAVIVPQASLTVIVNTQGSDANFHFHLTGTQDFDLQTNSLTASGIISMFAPSGSYTLSQDNALGLKVSNIFCTSDNPSDVFFYQQNSVLFTPKFFENITCTFNNVKATTPVLIVPGLLGTEMKNGADKLWLDLVHNFTDISDQFMNPLQFNNNLAPSDVSLDMGSVVGKETANVGAGKITVFDYTEGLVNEFRGQGYVDGQDLFTFPYDWRYGVSGKYADGTTNSDLLKRRINDILQQTGADKVDVVAHSLGGLIVKEYAMEHLADNHIGKAVFVGVPNTGAPKSVKVLLQGDSFGIPWLSQDEIKKISANMPAAYDLLPSQQYYNVKGDSYIEVVDHTDLFNTTLRDLNYEESKSFLTNDHGLNPQAVANSENLHTQSFDNFDLRTAGINLYAIDGCKAGTLGKVIEVRQKDILGNSYTTYDKPKEVPGDGTVPLESATNLPINQANKYYALVSDHGKMPSEDGIRQEIVNLISGSNLSTGNNLITQDISKCQLNGKAVSVFSPVDIFVTDQNGNKLGLAEDGSVINEIPNADFEIWGDSSSADKHKFAYLPTDNGQVYTINMQGTDTGTYTIKADNIQNSQTTKTEVFSNLSVSPVLTGQINISSGETTLAVDTNGDGATNEVLHPSAVLSGEQSNDLISPVSSATIVGERKKPLKKIISWLKVKKTGSDDNCLKVEIKASDGNSGVLNINYNLDGAGYQKISGDTADIDVAGEGEHTILFFFYR
jgi:triacylglycerol esterase/lipase EstA (alpha/beta hydrolase family)